MASPLEIYNEWQSRQKARDFAHLGEVVDLEGFRDICIGLSDWTTGYETAFQNLTRNILIPLADLRMTIEEIVEGEDAVLVVHSDRRSRSPHHCRNRRPRSTTSCTTRP